MFSERLKKYFFCLTVILIVSGSWIRAQTGTSASATGHITAEVITVYSATEMSQMNFGRFYPGPQGGEIILTPESTVSVMGSVYKEVGTQTAASFYVSGHTGTSFTITLPREPVLLNHVTSARTMIINDWISSPGTEPAAGILQNGAQMVYVGATLKIGTLEDNPVGVYAGTFNITFDFN
ncbi:MAG: DUF4402 domain-containing protein [Bacteroidales bacterium]|jgi:hypothetical protein|nr:DUF4402 domain-containing protein [Bacteroidales bacterium]